MTPDREAIFVAQDTVLVGLTTGPARRFGDTEREALYSLPPWRAVMFARIACDLGVMRRVERDGLINEARTVGGNGTLKPWAKRTTREQTYGVRAGVVTGLGQG